MLIKRTNPFDGTVGEMELDVTEEQMAMYNATSISIQEAFPHLTADEREFILTGITPKQWRKMFGDNDTRSDPNGM